MGNFKCRNRFDTIMIRELLFDPDAFMRRRAGDPGFAGPAVVVLLAAIAAILSGLLLVWEALKTVEGGMETVLAAGGAPLIVGGFVGVFAFWVLYAAAFHVISMAFDGDGDFRTTLSLVGWGFLPAIIGGIVTAIGTYLALQNVSAGMDPAAMEPFVQGMRSQPVYLAVSLVGIAMTLWQGYIWTFAVRHARSLDVRSAALTVAGPVALTILWAGRTLI
jgi:hypothetical protein